MENFGYLGSFLSAFALAFLLTPLVRLFAVKNGFIAFPRADRWHKNPTALLGGIGIYCATVIIALLSGIQSKLAFGLFLGGTFLFFVGLFDEKLRLTPYTKLLTQIIAACIAVYFGNIMALPLPAYLAIPITIFWIVGVTNSFNLLDNIDGLAAGIAAIAALMLFSISLFFSNNPLSIFALIIAGAALGFLPYNFNPAKIFMGDSGSMFLGYSLSVIAINGTGRHMSGLFISLLIPVLVLCVPIFDTIFVMIARKIQGKRIFQGGKDHTSHRLVTLGVSQKKTVLLLYAVSILFGLIAILYSAKLNLFLILVTTFLAAVLLLYFGFFLFEITATTDPLKYQKNGGNHVVLNSIFMYKRRIIEVLLDLTFICIAYYAAYFLRFENTQLEANLVLLKASFVWIILIKICCFFAFGLYRGVWRYISITDLLSIAKIVTVSSITSILFLTFAFRFNEYSRKVFFIDWLILLFLILGSRILFRVIGEFLNRARDKGKNVLIFGAGDMGESVIREIKRNKAIGYNPVGFIDDDHFKIGSKIQGIPVLGSREKLKKFIKSLEVEELLIAAPSITAETLAEIEGTCLECGIKHKRIKGILDE